MDAPDDTPSPRRPSRVRSIAQFLLGVALFIGLLWWVVPSWDTVLESFSPSLPLLAVSLLGSLFATFVTAARWKLLTEAMGTSPLRYGVYFHYLSLTRVVSQVLPSAVVDVLGRGAALRAAGSKAALGNLVAPVVLERLFDLLLTLCMLAWAVLIHFGPGAGPLGPWGSLLLVTAAFAVGGVALLRPTVRLALGALGKFRSLRGKTQPVTAPPNIPRPLATKIMALSVGRYLGILGQYWGAGAGFGVTLGALALVSAAPVAQLAGLIGITPGGLGFQEGGWVAALQQLGVAAGDIAVFMIATRLMMLVNFGIFTLASWRYRRG